MYENGFVLLKDGSSLFLMWCRYGKRLYCCLYMTSCHNLFIVPGFLSIVTISFFWVWGRGASVPNVHGREDGATFLLSEGSKRFDCSCLCVSMTMLKNLLLLIFIIIITIIVVITVIIDVFTVRYSFWRKAEVKSFLLFCLRILCKLCYFCRLEFNHRNHQ